MTEAVHLAVNARAGRGGVPVRTVRALIEAAGHTVIELGATSAEHTEHSVRSAVADGATRVVAVGGDGLVHWIVQALAGTPVVLGIIATGTGNDAARALGLPLSDLQAAVNDALGDGVPIDAMHSTAGWALTVATTGFSATVNERANTIGWLKGEARYKAATLAALPRLAPQNLIVGIDGVDHRVEATFIAIGNTRFFGGGMAVCPDAVANDGLLDVCIVGPLGRLKLLRFFPSVFSGAHRHNPVVSLLRGRTVSLAGAAAGSVWADGEYMAPLPITFEVIPGALLIASARPGYGGETAQLG